MKALVSADYPFRKFAISGKRVWEGSNSREAGMSLEK